MTIKHIGLLNIQRCDSHGAVLLAYAMEHFLLEEGYAVNTIDYKYAGRIVENNVLKKLINKLLIKWKKQLHMSYANKTVCGESVKSEYDIQHSHFEEFRKNLLTLTKEVTNVNDQMVNSFDAIVVGSQKSLGVLIASFIFYVPLRRRLEKWLMLLLLAQTMRNFLGNMRSAMKMHLIVLILYPFAKSQVFHL